MSTKISWTDETWNPIVGCSRVSPGCEHCYAEALAGRPPLSETLHYQGLTVMRQGEPRWTGQVRFLPDRLRDPLKWRKPRRIFVNSMSDMFHKSVKPQWIDAILEVMAATPHHTYQVLTKRAHRIEEKIYGVTVDNPIRELGGGDYLSNLWLGVSVEDQKRADERIPHLLQTPAAVRFLSCEPLLSPVSLGPEFVGNQVFAPLGEERRIDCGGCHSTPIRGYPVCEGHDVGGITWVIIGGESGPHHRPMKIEWLESIVDQCDRAGVPVFVKQDSGRWPGKQGRIPERLWARKEFPEVRL